MSDHSLYHLLAAVAAAALLALGAVQAAQAPGSLPRTVARLDAQRFAGTWYEVARVPGRMHAECLSDATAHYEPRPDGGFSVVHSCRTPTGRSETFVGRAQPQPGDATRAKWRVSFMPRWLQWLPVGQTELWVVMLAPDYRYAVVTEPTRRYLWVLSRTPHLPADELGRIVDRLRAQGYPTRQLVLTPQSAVLQDSGSDAAAPWSARPRLLV